MTDDGSDQQTPPNILSILGGGFGMETGLYTHVKGCKLSEYDGPACGAAGAATSMLVGTVAGAYLATIIAAEVMKRRDS